MQNLGKGGTVIGNSHLQGGEKFIIPETGATVELEGKEPVVSSVASQDPSVHEYQGTNKEILDEINRTYGGKPIHERVESVGIGDVVICKISAKDQTKRKLKGTNRQVLSAINESGGCAVIEKGAQKKEYENGGAVYYGYPFPMGNDIPDDILQTWLELNQKFYSRNALQAPFKEVSEVKGDPIKISRVAYIAEIESEFSDMDLQGKEYLYEQGGELSCGCSHEQGGEIILPKNIGARIKANKEEIYNILLDTADAGMFDGGCVIFARALQIAIGGDIVSVIRKDGTADHAAVQLGKLIFDGDGGLPVDAFIKRFNRNENANSVAIRPFLTSDLPEAPRNEEASTKIADLLKNGEGNWNFEDGGQVSDFSKLRDWPEIKSFLEGDLPEKAPSSARNKIAAYNISHEFNSAGLSGGQSEILLNIKPIPFKISDSKEPLKAIVGKDDLRPYLKGIYYDAKNKSKVATDAYALVVIKDDTITSTRLVNPKDGSTLTGQKFPNYLNFIAKENEYKAVLNQQVIQQMLNRLNGMVKAYRFISGYGDPVPALIINKAGEHMTFNPSNLMRVIVALVQYGAKSLILEYSAPNRPLLIKDAYTPANYGMVMPTFGEERPCSLIVDVRELNNNIPAELVFKNYEEIRRFCLNACDRSKTSADMLTISDTAGHVYKQTEFTDAGYIYEADLSAINSKLKNLFLLLAK